VLLVVGFILWFFIHFKPKVWDQRHGKKWFQNMTSCWNSFKSCKCCVTCWRKLRGHCCNCARSSGRVRHRSAAAAAVPTPVPSTQHTSPSAVS
jgi:hypothetical protein